MKKLNQNLLNNFKNPPIFLSLNFIKNSSHDARTFTKSSLTAFAGSWLLPSINPIFNSKNIEDLIIGHASHRYKIDLTWGALNADFHPVNDCHEIIKTTIDGKIVMTLPSPQTSGKYATADEYIPTETAVAPNGDIYVATATAYSIFCITISAANCLIFLVAKTVRIIACMAHKKAKPTHADFAFLRYLGQNNTINALQIGTQSPISPSTSYYSTLLLLSRQCLYI